MDRKIERIQYLTNKAERGVITPSEREELARLLGKDPKEYEGDDGLSTLLGIALAALLAGLLYSIFKGGKN